MFHSLLGASSIADKAHRLAVSAASWWITMLPFISLGLHLEPSQFQVAITWWLGMDTPQEVPFVLSALKSLLTVLAILLAVLVSCGEDAVTCHNQLRNVIMDCQSGM